MGGHNFISRCLASRSLAVWTWRTHKRCGWVGGEIMKMRKLRNVTQDRLRVYARAPPTRLRARCPPARRPVYASTRAVPTGSPRLRREDLPRSAYGHHERGLASSIRLESKMITREDTLQAASSATTSCVQHADVCAHRQRRHRTKPCRADSELRSTTKRNVCEHMGAQHHSSHARLTCPPVAVYCCLPLPKCRAVAPCKCGRGTSGD